jgi:hypothetical protein
MHDAELMRALTLGHSFCKQSPSEAFFEYQRHDDEIAQGVAPRYRTEHPSCALATVMGVVHERWRSCSRRHTDPIECPPIPRQA